jgi:PAS domain S-box-containing protein
MGNLKETALSEAEILLLPRRNGGPDGGIERRELISPNVARRLVHELRVHQSELEAQNEQLRNTQAELDALQSRYFDLYELAPVGYCTVSATEKLMSANLTAAQLLGLPVSKLVGRPIQQFIAPADQDIYYLHCKKLFETGERQSCELRLIKPDRSHFWAQLIATITLDAAGLSTHRIVLTDIDERKAAQDKIRISDLALKAVSQGVLITSADMRVVDANEAFLAMTGYSAADLTGISCSVFNGPLTDPAVLERCLTAIAEKKAFSCDILHYRKDRSCFWNGLSLSPVFDTLNHVTHFICINTDINERKRLDQALLDNNRALEQATELAEKANQAKSDFLSSMSHELRSPLNSILGFAQLLASGSPAPTPLQSKNIDKILRGGWYLLTLINDILDLALIESGKIALTVAPLPLAQLLTECQSMVEPQAEKHGVTVHFPLVATSTQVLADPIRLTQILVNLLSNAIKYNRPKGSVHVTVSAATPGALRIEVRDTGEGLPAEKLSQLFQAFNRLGQESSPIEGTGIGLVVTKRLTELMGGRLGVHSTVGVGSVFWLELPLADAAYPKIHSGESCAEKKLALSLLQHAACTILYVEDNLANVELVEQILQGHPTLRLIRAHNGMQGIDMARSHAPQIILMDINLPGMSGMDALKLLRQDPVTRHIPVLAITANALPADVTKGMAAGFFNYLTKPFKIQDFLQSIDLALQAPASPSHAHRERSDQTPASRSKAV